MEVRNMVRFEEYELEIMKKSGQVIGHVGNNYISEIYQLDRTRNVEDFEKQIKNIALRAISIGKKEEESVYAYSDAMWPLIPIQSGHPFRCNLATPEGLIERRWIIRF
jgi:hypothetical protein